MIPFKSDLSFNTNKSEDFLDFVNAKESKLNREMFDLSQLMVDDIGNIKLNNETKEISRTGLKNLCSFLGIPNPFAKKIPTDLLIHNINRLTRERLEKDRRTAFSAFFNSENHIVDIHDKDNHDISLEQFFGTYSNLNDDEHKIKFSFQNNEFSAKFFLNNDQSKITLANHEHLLGTTLDGSLTGRFSPDVSMGLYTLVCSNGLTVLDRNFLDSSIEISLKYDIKNIIENFNSDKLFNYLLSQRDDLIKQLSVLESHELNFGELQFLIKKFRRSLKEEVDLEQKTSYMLKPEDFEKFVNLKSNKADVEDLTNIKLYDVYYQITDLSSNFDSFDFSTKTKLNKFANNLIFDKLEMIEA